MFKYMEIAQLFRGSNQLGQGTGGVFGTDRKVKSNKVGLKQFASR